MMFSQIERSGSEDVHQLSQESRLLLLEVVEFALVKPYSFATETLVHTDLTEGDFFKVHTALRALHEMQGAPLLPFLLLQFRLTLFRHLPPALHFQSSKVLLLGITGLYRHISSFGRKMDERPYGYTFTKL